MNQAPVACGSAWQWAKAFQLAGILPLIPDGLPDPEAHLAKLCEDVLDELRERNEQARGALAFIVVSRPFHAWLVHLSRYMVHVATAGNVTHHCKPHLFGAEVIAWPELDVLEVRYVGGLPRAAELPTCRGTLEYRKP